MSDDRDQSSENPPGSAPAGEESLRQTSSSISGQNAVVSTSTNGSPRFQRGGPHDEDLVQASTRGDLDKVKELIRKGATADAIVGERDTTPLYCAAKYGHLNVVEYLIEDGADIFARRRHSGTTPLHIAAEAGYTAVVNALLNASPSSMCERDADGMTPLHRAVKNHKVATVEYLLTKSVTPLSCKDRSGSTPLLTAVTHSWSKMTRTLLPHLGASDLGVTNNAGWNALDICIKNRRFITAAALLKTLTPDDLEASSADAHSALTRAVFMNLEEFVRLLLGHNARVNVAVSDKIMSDIWRPQQGFQEKAEQLGLSFTQNFAPDSSVYRPDESVDPRAEGNRPKSVLSVAVTLANAKIVDLLLRNQNEVDFTIGEEGSALYFACERGYESIVESLLRCRPRPDVDNKVNQGAAPIHAASRWCHWNIVGILLDNGATADEPDQKCPFGWTGLTPLHYAILAENLKIVQKIMEPIVEAALQEALQKGIEIGGKRMNALHVAALSGGDSVLRYLLNRGADPSLRNSNGDTVLHVAVSSGNAAGVRALLDPHDSPRAYNPKDLLEVKNNSGETAWALAIISTFRNAEVVQTFLQYPESIDLTLNEIESSILWAAKHREIHDLVRLQLRRRPSTFLEDLNTKLSAVLHRDSWTALHWASYHGHRYLVGRLIQSGGNKVEVARASARKMVELILAHLNQPGDLKSDYDDTLHMLRYPDIQLDPDIIETSNLDQLNQRPTHAGVSQKDLEGFDGRIVDFYAAEGDIPTFLPQSRSVHQVLYDHGPEQIMDRVRMSRDMRFGLQNLKFRWIHLPANNVGAQISKDCIYNCH
jgi:ankyrin repeat protein